MTDPLGFAGGSWRLEISGDGVGAVKRTDAAADVRVSVNELAALLLGGTRATTLRAAGRLSAAPDTASRLDASFAPSRTPYSSVWY